MPQPELRLLAAAVALEEFSIAELAVAAKCNAHTARSWVTRVRHLLHAHPTPKEGRGRPNMLFNLTQIGKQEMGSRLSELQRDIAGLAASRPRREMLYEVTSQFEIWNTIRETGDDNGALQTLKILLRGSWQRLARLEALGESVADDALRQLAEMEAEAGIVMPDVDLSLPELAKWTVARLQRICDQDASQAFAARSTWLRLETRPFADKATAAVLAAAVWADEGWATADIPEQTWHMGLRIAELIPLESRLQRVHTVLGEADIGYCKNDGEAQAVVRGLTACKGAPGQGMLRDWLSAARARRGWRDALAPMVVHGLLQADGVRLIEAIAPFRPALENGLNQYVPHSGRLRNDAIRRSKMMLSTPLLSFKEQSLRQLATSFGSRTMSLALAQG